MSDDDVIGEPRFNLRLNYQQALADAAKANAGVQVEFQKGNKKLEQSQKATMVAMQQTIDRITGRRATQELNLIAQAVDEIGGRSKLSGDAIKRLTADVERLAAAGAKVPKSLQGIEVGGAGVFGKVQSELGQQVTSRLSGMGPGGVAGEVLSAIGPGGMALAASLAPVVAGLGAVAAGAHVAGEALDKALDKGHELSVLKEETGLGAQALQEYAPAALTAGKSIEELASTVSKFQQKLISSPKTFKALGLDPAELAAMKPEEAIEKAAQAISEIQNAAQRAAAVKDIFGKSGATMLPVLLHLSEMKARAHELGLVLGDETVEKLAKLDDEMDLTKAAAEGVETQFGAIIGTSPGTTEAVKAIGLGFGDLSREIAANKGPVQELVSLLSVGLTKAINIVANTLVNGVRVAAAEVHNLQEAWKWIKSAGKEGGNITTPGITWTDFGAMAGLPGKEPKKPGGNRTYKPPDQTATERAKAAFDQADVKTAEEMLQWRQKLIAAGVGEAQVGELIKKKYEEQLKLLLDKDKLERQTLGFVSDETKAKLAQLADEEEAQVRIAKEEEKRVQTEGRVSQGAAVQNEAWGKIARQMRASGDSSAQIATWLKSMGVSAEDADVFIQRWAPSFEDVAAKAEAAGKSVEQIRVELQRLGARPPAVKQALESIGIQVLDTRDRIQQVGEGLINAGQQAAQFGGALGMAGNAATMLGAAVVAVSEATKGGVANAQKLEAAYQAAAAAAVSVGQSQGGYNTGRGGYWTGMGQGAQAGSAFGGYGTLIGAIVGAFAGGIVGIGHEKEVKRAGNQLYERMSQSMLDGLKQEAESRGISLDEEIRRILEEQRKMVEERFADALGDESLSMDQLKAIKKLAAEAGQSLEEYLDTLAEPFLKAAEKQRKIEAGLNQAKEGAQAMEAALQQGDWTDAARKAAEQILAKIKGALIAAGMGFLDKRLEGSEGYKSAQGLAHATSQAITGAQQAGIYDASVAAAGGVVAEEAYKKAVEAARKAGIGQDVSKQVLGPDGKPTGQSIVENTQANKAGFNAVAELLKSQLNASLLSGTALDAKTQALIDEAKKNGINIVADPMAQQVDLQRKMLANLDIIAAKQFGADTHAPAPPGSNGPGPDGTTPPPPGPGETPTSANRGKPQGYARGIWAANGIYGTVTTPDLGGGLSYVAQLHPREQLVVLPEGVAPYGADVIPRGAGGARRFRSFATGLSSLSAVSGIPTAPLSSSLGRVLGSASSLASALSHGGGAGTGAAAPQVNVTTPTTVNVSQSPLDSAESRRDTVNLLLDGMNAALKAKSHPVAVTVSRQVDEKIQAALQRMKR